MYMAENGVLADCVSFSPARFLPCKREMSLPLVFSAVIYLILVCQSGFYFPKQCCAREKKALFYVMSVEINL